jgi:hypothetical protein
MWVNPQGVEKVLFVLFQYPPMKLSKSMSLQERPLLLYTVQYSTTFPNTTFNKAPIGGSRLKIKNDLFPSTDVPYERKGYSHTPRVLLVSIETYQEGKPKPCRTLAVKWEG